MADYHLDAKAKRLGRLASEIATILQGKRSAEYEPRRVGGDRVFLANYRGVTLSGRKADSKVYLRHTGYVGHLKAKRFKDAFAKDPKWVIREAVRHMLPKNALNRQRMRNLIFVEEQ